VLASFLGMKRRRNKKGQALVEYAFLMVLLATIGFAVVALAGNQLLGLYSDVSYEFTHILEPIPPPPPASTCQPGYSLQQHGHQWKCQQSGQH
jgi:Flp pilus assembly pilin Flp